MKNLLSLCFLVLAVSPATAQTLFRSGIFLHHSTGACIWGPNGSSTSVPQEMVEYNTFHGYTGQQAVTMNEEWWSSPDNEWSTQHAFFEDPNPITGIGYYLPGNKIVVIKSCFPSSAMTDAGQAGDTLYPEMKTIYNYKWHWRHIVHVMRSHPDNFFVIWTNAPLEPFSTTPSEAALSKWFCTWAKDTLALGLDPVFGTFPANVYVFDFFHKLTGPDGMMLPQYAAGPGDSHPNAAATELVAPQFVQEIFNASIGYEIVYGIPHTDITDNQFLKAFPNPIGEKVTIFFRVSGVQHASLTLFDAIGRKKQTLWTGEEAGTHGITVIRSDLMPGLYFLRLSDGGLTRTLLLLCQ
jgi:hypothetical protein